MRAFSGLLTGPVPWLDRLPLGPLGATPARARLTGAACLAPLWALPLFWDREIPLWAAVAAIALAILFFRRGSRLARP